MENDSSTIAAPTSGHAERLRRRLLLAVVAAALLVALLPLDVPLAEALTSIRPSGDLRRELELIQQFGSPTTIGLVLLLVWRLDRPRLRLVLDWIVAAAVSGASMFAFKVLCGRVRPRLGAPPEFLGPFGRWSTKTDAPPQRPWEILAPNTSDLWSMPSSHTAAATVAAVALSRMYPRLAPVVWSFVAIVAYARVTLGAHWPTDVLVGGVLAYFIADAVMQRELGQRLWGGLFKKR